MTKKEIFKTAWIIAKHGATKFGGSPKEYFSESLKMAYKRGDLKIIFTLEIASGSRNHKSWVSKIEGTDPKWGFKRKFIDPTEPGIYDLEDGVYNFKDAPISYQQYLVVKNGQATEIEKEEVLANL
ncbi:hypothetical protein IGI37_000117 [Enterococcus sp. AZ194]|uniref:hypothetical protein n=1 Tax=Enterococcus sp. AZ194 TaxID=2774629 RepID=UPI003F25F4CF